MAIFHQWWLWIAFMFLFFVGPLAMVGATASGGRHTPVHSEASGRENRHRWRFRSPELPAWGWGGD